MLVKHRANGTTSAVAIAQAVRTMQGQDASSATMMEKEPVTYRHVASAAVVVAAARTSGLGVDSSETRRAGLVQHQMRLAARHPASSRPS